MSVADSLLSNETVVFASRKHPIALARDAAPAGGLVLVGLILWLGDPNPQGLFAFVGALLALIRWACLLAGVGWIAYAVVAWRRAEFAVTSVRVLRYEGLLTRRATELPLAKVSDVKVSVGILGRSLGFGDVQVFTQTGGAGTERFASITRPGAFRTALLTAKVEAAMGRRVVPSAVAPAGGSPVAAPAPGGAVWPAPAAASAPEGAGWPTAGPSPGPSPAAAPWPSPAAAPSLEDQAARLIKLAELRDRGILTTEEFDAKKAEILARM